MCCGLCRDLRKVAAGPVCCEPGEAQSQLLLAGETAVEIRLQTQVLSCFAGRGPGETKWLLCGELVNKTQAAVPILQEEESFCQALSCCEKTTCGMCYTVVPECFSCILHSSCPDHQVFQISCILVFLSSPLSTASESWLPRENLFPSHQGTILDRLK